MRNRLLFLIILATYILPNCCLAQYQMPKDSRYWDYYNWYTSHVIVSLVLSGKDLGHFNEAIAEIPKLKQKGIIIGDVMVIGLPNTENRKETADSIQNFMDKLKFTRNGMESSKDVVDKYSIKYSPTWIIRHKGKEYVYEGLRTPLNLFTSQGVFKDAK